MNNYYKDNESLKFYLNHPLMKEIVTLKEKQFSEREKYKEAPENFEDAIDNYDRILCIVGEIAADVIAENAEAIDREGPCIKENRIIYANGTQKNHQVLQKAGLYGMSLPRKYDGLNFPYVPYVMTAEIISRADAGFANIWGLQDCAETINEFASEEIKNEYLPRIKAGDTCSMDLTEPDAGSDLQSVRLKASYDENSKCWRLNGVKRFITNGGADIHLVLARSEADTSDGRGLSYFLYDKKNPGLTIRRIENKMGIKGSPTAELVFDNAAAQLIGKQRLGLIKYVMSLMNGARLGVAAQSVGLSEAAYREACTYAEERCQFGHSINKFPAVYEMLAGMKSKIDAMRSLLYETSRHVDMYKLTGTKSYKQKADLLTPVLKLFASEFANQIAYDCIQIHGGSGFMKEYTCERLYRDARILSIYEGTSQLQVVAAHKGIGNKAYLKIVETYNSEIQAKNSASIELKKRLWKMKEKYEEMFELYSSFGQNELYEFHTRRMVESIAWIIMGYLLLADSQRDDKFLTSCEWIVDCGEAEIAKNHTFMCNFKESLLNKIRK